MIQFSHPRQGVFLLDFHKDKSTIQWTSRRQAAVVEGFGEGATIHIPISPFGSATIEFPRSLDMENVSVRPIKFIDKAFVYDDVKYTWEIRSGFFQRNYALYKGEGEDRAKIGSSNHLADGMDGNLSLNTSEIDILVGILSFAVVIKGK